MHKIPLIGIAILLFSCTGNHANRNESQANDSIRTFLQTYRQHIDTNPDSAFIAAGKALLVAQKISQKSTVLFDVYYAAGHSAEQTGQYDMAVACFTKAVEYRKGVDVSRLATAYNFIGQIAFRQGKYDVSMKYFPDALKIRIIQNDTEGQASSYRNIGSVCQAERKYREAKAHYLKSIELYKQLTPPASSEGIADCCNNLGGLYAEQAKYSRAFEYYRKSEQLYEQANSRDILVPVYNMGLAFADMGDSRQAGEYFRKALAIAMQLPDNRHLLAEACHSLGEYFQTVGQTDSALQYFNRSVEIAQQSMLDEIQARALVSRARTFSAQRNFSAAVSDYESAGFISDELNRSSQAKAKLFTQRYMQYETEAFRQQLLQRNSMLRSFIIALTTGILLICAIAVILYRNNIQKKKINAILAQQRDEIEEKNREIEAGLRSACLVQKAVLTPDEYIRQLFPEHFILYKPLKTVSGDFYWIMQKGRYIVTAVADCTGHALSGAIVSMLGISALNKIVGGMEIPHSNVILNSLRNDIIQVLNPEGAVDEVKNGMDIALAVIDTELEQIEFSGAKNSLYLIRNGELTVVKADRMSVGVDGQECHAFTAQQINYRKADMIYMFSDGYADQFNAADKHKFGTRRLKELLLSVSDSNPVEQLKILDSTHSSWRGKISQTDDILVMGIRF